MLCVKRSVPNVPTATTFFENHFKKRIFIKSARTYFSFFYFFGNPLHTHTGFSDLTWVGISEPDHTSMRVTCGGEAWLSILGRWNEHRSFYLWRKRGIDFWISTVWISRKKIPNCRCYLNWTLFKYIESSSDFDRPVIFERMCSQMIKRTTQILQNYRLFGQKL